MQVTASKRRKTILVLFAVMGMSVLTVRYAPVLLHRILDRMILTIDFEAIPFESALWKATPSEFSYDSIRLKMVDDLLAQHPLVGKHRDKIVELIGEPDDTTYFHEYPMVYHLGMEHHPMGIDSEWLVIQLNDQNIATEAILVTD